ncbi:toll/interleukin-1 receptor domain-containing protein [Lysinibacillus sphaericus]|uniref:toll/interleukin-1 receptor domain-containing protein n=1 Tax=Lysinibacillus sphaericus TaxID=1421 RepID=UPI001911165C|nr:toll/interleukin-1 receptor domain-containing protein [Lysinibacillus sphaericus]QPA56799.1 TIR domain-containing protein [Lysinibacillus sphaericus]
MEEEFFIFKAFLSHTNSDKEFVEKVAGKLGRERVVFDKYIFPEGEDFRDSIMKYLKESDLFVLFASKESLKANWVKYEIDNAEMLLIEEKLKKGLVFLIGDDISHSQLPKWCQKSLVKRISKHNLVADIIEEKLLEINPKYSDVYIGRGIEKEKFTDHLFKSKIKHQVLVFYGLNGIGRRTFAKDIMHNIYNLKLGKGFNIEPADELVNLYLNVMDEVNGFTSKADYKNHIDAFRQISLNEQVDEIVNLLKVYSENRISPCLIDNGGLMDNSGRYKEEYLMLMKKINETSNLYLTIIQTRNPYYIDEFSDNDKKFFVTYLTKLTDSAMNGLLSTYLNNLEIRYDNHDIEEFTQYLDGYPPAAQFARNSINTYGLDVALADKTMLSEFKAKKFTEYLNKVVSNNQIKIKLLRVCEALPPLKYVDIMNICLDSNESIKREFQDLIDESVLTVDLQNNTYTLATPLREAVRRNWGALSKKEFEDIATKLKDIYWDEEKIPTNDILDTLIFCLLRSGNNKELAEFTDVLFPSTIMKAASSAYINREWNTVISLCRKALALNNELDSARIMLFKSLVRENENSDLILAELSDRKHPEYYPLRAFRDLKKSRYDDALKNYNLALARGYHTIAVYREIAECYYRLDDYENASMYIEKAIEKDKMPNGFILDLAAKIAIEKLEFDKAQEYINKLEVVDTIENVYHRKASLLSKQLKYNEAIKYAELACKRQPPLPETFLNKAFILTQLERYEEANSTLLEFKGLFKSHEKRDFYNELMCLVKLNIAGWEEAQIFYEKLSSNSLYANYLKFIILVSKSEDLNLSLVERLNYKKEIEKLKSEGMEEFNEQNLFIKV